MDTALKQRLVGASVLIALAVVVLPMLLGGRPDEGHPESQKIELPPQPAELDFETRRYPIGDKNPAPRPDTESATPKPLPSPKRSIETPSPDSTEPESLPPVASIELDSQKEPEVSPLEAEPEPRPLSEPVSGPVSEPAREVMTPSSDKGRYVVQVASFGAVAW